MKEINLASKLVSKRKEKGVTQADLALYIGVSKASVSKWETGQSYPDITFLPLLAAYFNVSIDELMGYEPQMTKEDIKKLYLSLCGDFSVKPFDEVLARCQEIAKKYYSCFPLLFQIGALLVNYSMLPGDPEKNADVLTQAKELFIRVKQESDDAELCKTALNMEALCQLSLGNPGEVLNLLEDTRAKLSVSNEALLASAYQMLGKTGEAKTIIQVAAYQGLLGLVDSLRAYMELCMGDFAIFEKAFGRADAVADIFQLDKLLPSVLMNLYLTAAKGFLLNEQREEALHQLERYFLLQICM